MYIWYCALAVLAGMLIPLQAGVNAQLRAWLGSPHYATLVSLIVSLASMSLVCLASRQPPPDFAAAAQAPWWAWTGGIAGVVLVFLALVLAPKLGATALVASIIGGQMLCSLVFDQFALIGFHHHPINLARIAGTVLLFAGVLLIQRS